MSKYFHTQFKSTLHFGTLEARIGDMSSTTLT